MLYLHAVFISIDFINVFDMNASEKRFTDIFEIQWILNGRNSFYGIFMLTVVLRKCVVNANTELSPTVDTIVILYRLYVFTIPRTLNKTGTI